MDEAQGLAAEDLLGSQVRAIPEPAWAIVRLATLRRAHQRGVIDLDLAYLNGRAYPLPRASPRELVDATRVASLLYAAHEVAGHHDGDVVGSRLEALERDPGEWLATRRPALRAAVISALLLDGIDVVAAQAEQEAEARAWEERRALDAEREAQRDAQAEIERRPSGSRRSWPRRSACAPTSEEQRRAAGEADEARERERRERDAGR